MEDEARSNMPLLVECLFAIADFGNTHFVHYNVVV